MLEPARALEAEDAGLAAADAAPLAPRLLVIDDDHLHCAIICRIAAKAGFDAVRATTYEAAASLAQETAFDCITLDLSLGEHAGIEMLRHLWVLGCKAPIIIVSGCDDRISRETVRIGKSLNLKIQEPVPKPVDLAVLRYSLERLRAQVKPAARQH
jgi:two-component system, chemotaxis family, chemotaxis protein CheY